ncbi:MAG: CvpA family protein [Candidatus Fimenecus sp.]
MVIDIILLCLFLTAVVISAKKGIVRTVLDIAAFVLTVVIASQIAAPMAKSFYSTFLSERIETRIEDALTSSEAATNTQKAAVVLESLPDAVKGYIEKADIRTDILAQKIATGQVGADMAAYLNTEIAQPICEAVITVLLFLLFCVVLGCLLQWVAGGIAKMFKLPIVKTANAALGAVFGAAKGVIVVYIAVALLVFITPRASGSKLQQAVHDSQVVAFTEQYLPESVFGEWI